jgi:glucan phosphoethanolaminetransferase (alkaline phosphatase superfamily)
MSSTITQGGMLGHAVRRLIHLSIALVPVIYYGVLVSMMSLPARHAILIGLVVIVFILECIRIRQKWVLFGQRYHESNRFSAFAWTVISIAIVLLVLQSPIFAFPIIISCALADPVVGEMRAHRMNTALTAVLGVCVVACVWLFFAYHFHFSYALALLMAPITIAVEWPSFRWVDDNALMMLVPLVVVMI